MKANLKGLGGIKHLLLAHGEKLGIVVVGLCAAVLVYHALVREKLPADKQADKLGQQITEARNSMEGFTWPDVKEQFASEFRFAKPLEQKGSQEIDAGKYVNATWNIPWDRSPVPPIVLRTDPLLLEAQGLEARGGSGLLAFVDPAVRRRKMLEEREKETKRESEQKKVMERSATEDTRGGGRTRGRGGEQADPYGAAGYDPEHPKRRAVVGMVRPAGVPLQDYEEVRVAHWAVVVAKISIKEQLKLYRDAFENARGYDLSADVPQYLGYFVERAEIRPGEEDKDLRWEKVQVYDGKSTLPVSQIPVVSMEALYGKPEDLTTKTPAKLGVVTNWSSQMPEVADPRYLGDSVLAFPLPPLVGRDWGAEVTHPDIPLAADAVPEEEKETKPEATQPKADEDAEPGDLFAGGGTAGAVMGGQPGYGGGRGYGGEMGGRMGGEGRGYGGYGGGYGMRGAGGYGMGRGEGGYGEGAYGGAGRGGMGSGSSLAQGGEPLAPFWLLRFFDFSVQPGKKYKYKVRLAMLDPNQSYGARMVGSESLDSAVIARVKKWRAAHKPRPNAPPPTPFRPTEWSVASRTVSIPLAGSVRVASAKPASDRFNDEPSTTLLVESFGTDEKSNAIQVAKEKTFQRGSVANMTEDAEKLVEQGRAIDPVDNFKFQTDITVVDIRGGERLTRSEQRPGRVLLMGPAGQLFVQDETEDADAVEVHKQTFAKEPAAGAPGGYMRGEGYGGPGYYGGEGGGRGR